MIPPIADVSVRVAWSADAEAIGVVQVRAWRDRYGAVLPTDVLDSLSAEAFAAQWRASIARPREARQRVLVALERATVRGFTATSPASDDDAIAASDAELVEFAVDPGHLGAGHGSRLLHAAVDTMRSDSFTRATVWLVATDDTLRAFFTGRGWAPDGAHRELDLHGDGSIVVKQIRLHTDLTVP